MANRSFWTGKRVLVTGHTGFKGSWLALWLRELGAEVIGVSLPPASRPNLFEIARVSEGIDSLICDIRDSGQVATLLRAKRPEVIFHLAAQPLVKVGYREPLSTFTTNVMGTAHVLDAMRGLNSVRVALMITTDKVYQNTNANRPYGEDDPLGGHDPYSASKAACELVIASYRDAFLQEQGVSLASARAGNVLGGGDWSENRLIPDAVRAWQIQKPVEIRNPQSVRPWQHVLDPLHGYLKLAQSLWEHPELAGAYNFGPSSAETAPVQLVVDLARAAFGSGQVHYVVDDKGPYEADWLALETTKAREALSLAPSWGLMLALERTMSWYKLQRLGRDARELCLADIQFYEDNLG